MPAALRDLPGVGPIVLGHDVVVYVSWALVAVAGYVLYRTSRGLSLRAIGEDPAAADAAGLNVVRTRYLATAIGGFGAGMGGAYLSLVVLGTWQTGLTAGIGLDRRRPGDPRRLAAVAGAGRRVRVRSAARAGVHARRSPRCRCPSDFLNMIPFIAAYVVVIVVSASPSRARRVAAPAALGEPYARESR